jgi:hypothetical protein
MVIHARTAAIDLTGGARSGGLRRVCTHITSRVAGVVGIGCLVALVLYGGWATQSVAQSRPTIDTSLEGNTAFAPSPQGAFLRSFLVPGWGHRWVDGGVASANATRWTVGDLGIWILLINNAWRKDINAGALETQAFRHAGVQVSPLDDRAYALAISSYLNSETYLEELLRARAFGNLTYGEDPLYAWSWDDISSYRSFQALREERETLQRRVLTLTATLVGYRLLSGVFAARKASLAGASATTTAHGGPPDEGSNRFSVLPDRVQWHPGLDGSVALRLSWSIGHTRPRDPLRPE